MPRPEMTIKLARAAALDAGNRHAVKEGRQPTHWAKEDYDTAVAEFDRLCAEFDLVLTTGSGGNQ